MLARERLYDDMMTLRMSAKEATRSLDQNKMVAHDCICTFSQLVNLRFLIGRTFTSLVWPEKEGTITGYLIQPRKSQP